jgi:hypothetical protein
MLPLPGVLKNKYQGSFLGGVGVVEFAEDGLVLLLAGVFVFLVFLAPGVQAFS